jgi:hypothetical protein
LLVGHTLRSRGNGILSHTHTYTHIHTHTRGSGVSGISHGATVVAVVM